MKDIKICTMIQKKYGEKDMNKIMVTASTHPAKDNIIEYVDCLQKNNVKIGMLHVDIMDGVFVEDKTFGYEKVKEIYSMTAYPLDCHLMVKEPMNIVDKYIESGANIITVHYEAFGDEKNLVKCLKKIKDGGCMAGIAINPATRISVVAPYIDLIDMVLIMSVVPGKSGQKFMPEVINKIISLRHITKNGKNLLIEVDGGINIDTISFVKNIGVDMGVCGSALFNSTDKNALIEELTKN